MKLQQIKRNSCVKELSIIFLFVLTTEDRSPYFKARNFLIDKRNTVKCERWTRRILAGLPYRLSVATEGDSAQRLLWRTAHPRSCLISSASYEELAKAAHSLLAYGAHLDRVNNQRETAAQVWTEGGVLALPEWLREPGAVPKLQCLSARVVRSENVEYDELTLPAVLCTFAELHWLCFHSVSSKIWFTFLSLYTLKIHRLSSNLKIHLIWNSLLWAPL